MISCFSSLTQTWKSHQRFSTHPTEFSHLRKIVDCSLFLLFYVQIASLFALNKNLLKLEIIITPVGKDFLNVVSETSITFSLSRIPKNFELFIFFYKIFNP